jgi:Helix-turn-helix domain
MSTTRRLRRRTRWGIGIRLSNLKPTTKYVAFMIQTWADENGERARPSYPTIAKSSGLVRSTIAYHVKKLHDSGWLSIRSNRGRTHSNIYTLTIPAVYEALIEQTLGEENVRPDGPYEDENVQQEGEKRPPGADKTSDWSDPSLPEPSIEPPTQGDLTPPWVALGMTVYEWNQQGQPQPETEERSEEKKPGPIEAVVVDHEREGVAS